MPRIKTLQVAAHCSSWGPFTYIQDQVMPESHFEIYLYTRPNDAGPLKPPYFGKHLVELMEEFLKKQKLIIKIELVLKHDQNNTLSLLYRNYLLTLQMVSTFLDLIASEKGIFL